jgi:hypothetical protein
MKLAISSNQPATTALLQEIAHLCAAHGAQWLNPHCSQALQRLRRQPIARR